MSAAGEVVHQDPAKTPVTSQDLCWVAVTILLESECYSVMPKNNVRIAAQGLTRTVEVGGFDVKLLLTETTAHRSLLYMADSGRDSIDVQYPQLSRNTVN